jgi:hypothetical protein
MHTDVQKCHHQYGTVELLASLSHTSKLTPHIGDVIRYGPSQLLTLHQADLICMFFGGYQVAK